MNGIIDMLTSLLLPFGRTPGILKDFFFVIGMILVVENLWNISYSYRIRQLRYTIVIGSLLAGVLLEVSIIRDFYYMRENGTHDPAAEKLLALPFVIWLLFLLLVIAGTMAARKHIKKWEREHITPISVLECANQMPAGICFFRHDGLVVFCNRFMERAAEQLTGAVLRNGMEFSRLTAQRIFAMPDGTVVRFQQRETMVDGESLLELTAFDITELHKKNQELQKDTENLERVKASLKEYNLNIDDVIREREILNAKVNIHDEMNRLMLATKVSCDRDAGEEERKHILAQWKSNALLLCKEGASVGKTIPKKEIGELADLLGIRLHWEGLAAADDWIPPEKISELIAAAARECIANAVKHAAADTLWIDCFETENGQLHLTFRNNGDRPEGEIREGGGLTNLRRLVQAAGGTMGYVINERFCLKLDF
ncbi:MAG: hypothetical protein Q4B22_00420 [Eubacteriales bacterium]|nr:hypothetical protein [Eubacteriales bacterium]